MHTKRTIQLQFLAAGLRMHLSQLQTQKSSQRKQKKQKYRVKQKSLEHMKGFYTYFVLCCVEPCRALV